MNPSNERAASEKILEKAKTLQENLSSSVHDDLTAAVYGDAAEIASRSVSETPSWRQDLDRKVDRIVTSRVFGFPIMLGLLALVFWLTIIGANYPSQMLADGLFWLGDQLKALFEALHSPWWLTGFLIDGVYVALAWVVAVMLPPMAIFFPCFTLLEDLGYMPRVAFNMDRLFRAVGAHGKQALTMSMGFGCNAAGITACRIIDSPRERLIAIITNNFVPCNGRFPTLIMLSVVFVAAAFPSGWTSIAAAGSVVAIVLLGIGVTLLVSLVLSKTVLKGEASAFTLELPPYRRPRILKTMYTSLIDRTIFVMGRAIAMAAPAGGACWLLGNINIGDGSLMSYVSGALDPFGIALGLDGVILLAYIVAIPANEIVVPTILMAYTSAGKMFDMGYSELEPLLAGEHGWTLLTAVCLMLFSLLHYPCSTTLWTIWKETKSVKWTTVSALMPLGIAFAVCFAVAQTVRGLGWV